MNAEKLCQLQIVFPTLLKVSKENSVIMYKALPQNKQKPQRMVVRALLITAVHCPSVMLPDAL